MQRWHYDKGLIYYRPIFRLTTLPRRQNYTETKYLLTVPKILIQNSHKLLIINYNYRY